MRPNNWKVIEETDGDLNCNHSYVLREKEIIETRVIACVKCGHTQVMTTGGK